MLAFCGMSKPGFAQRTLWKQPLVAEPARALAELVLRLLGWKVVGGPPEGVPKLVVIGAPHTSNWDFLLFLAMALHLRMAPRFLGKHTLFRPPFGWLFRWLGGLPVDRRAPHGVVTAIAEEIRAADEMYLVMSPEGTRSRRETWRSGFYEIAMRAGIPILPAALDFGRKEVRFGEAFTPSGDTDADMAMLAVFYRDIRGKRPELFTPPKL
jgi:1-acyl-sn-glycerol-3-phosphate acyltransferase